MILLYSYSVVQKREWTIAKGEKGASLPFAFPCDINEAKRLLCNLYSVKRVVGKKRMCCYFQCSCDVLSTMGLLKCLTVAARLFLKNGGAAQFISEPNVQFNACMQSSRHHEVMTSRDQKWIANYTACTE